ncbi:unnamed protein product, partial [Symbiodinium necroappetens]
AREKQLYEIIANLKKDSEEKSRPSRNDSVTSLASSVQTRSTSPPPVEDAKPPEPSSTAGALEPDEEDEVEQSAVYKKLYARMEAKIRRMCTPTPGSGKVSGAPELVADWKQKGYKRTQLVKLMIEADGDKADFQSKVESWRKTEQFKRKVMKVKEFCEKHGYVRSNQYDSEELEYWVDFRTEGSRGYSETDGVLESRAADTTGANGFAMPGINDDPMCELPVQGSGAPGLQKESDKGELVVSKIMDEAIQTRRSLDKLVAKLKKENGHKKDISSMEDCQSKLSELYDDLAGIQAEVKVNGMNEKLQQQLDEKVKAVKRQTLSWSMVVANRCVLAVSCEIKNKSLKRKDTDEKEKPVPAKDIVERARASQRDGDLLCATCKAVAAIPDGHEESGVYNALLQTKLLVAIPWTYVNIGDGPLEQHPCFCPKDFIKTMADLNRFHCVVGTELASAPAVLKDFWCNFKKEFATHPIAAMNDLDTEHLVPLSLHGDGGRTYKKSELMILQWQPAIGAGTSKTKSSSNKRKLPGDIDAAGVNLLGHSLATRYLMSVLLKKHYIEDSAPLQSLLGCISDWFGDLWTNGYEFQGQVWRFIPLGLKGDLVFQAKAANLLRSFTRVRKKAKTSKSKALDGCCPWCLAGTEAFPFECFDKAAGWMQTAGARNPLPWTVPPSILRAIPHDPDQPSFLKPDLFHVLQMGVYKEYAASGLCMLLPHCGGTSNDDNMTRMNRYLHEYCKERKTNLHLAKLSLELIGAKTPNTYACGGWNKGQDSVTLMGFVPWISSDTWLDYCELLIIVARIPAPEGPSLVVQPPQQSAQEWKCHGPMVQWAVRGFFWGFEGLLGAFVVDDRL